MTSANPETGRPRQVEKELTTENLPPMLHREALPMIPAPHIDPEALRIIRQHLEESSTK
jgi:hypothetical protein